MLRCFIYITKPLSYMPLIMTNLKKLSSSLLARIIFNYQVGKITKTLQL